MSVSTQNTTKNIPVLAWLLLFFLSLVWGTSFVLIKKGLEVFSPLQVASLRISSAFLVVFVPAFFHFRGIPRKKIPYLFLSGLLGNLIPAFLFALAQTKISSSVASILNSLTPFFTFTVGVLFFQKKLVWQKIFGISLGILGTLLIFIQKGKLDFNIFAILIVFATLGYGFNVNLTGKYLSDVKPIKITSISIFMVGLIANIFLFGFTDFWLVVQQNPDSRSSLLAVMILGIVGSGISSILFYKLLQISSPLFASSVTYFIPIIGISLGLMSGEKITIWHLLGMITIVSGVLLMNKKNKEL
ncbi:MAG: DMT family transporter [Thermonemataceae bacterium]|nr:DMT family transporter [Thermonemataceae bacterium]